MKSRRFGIAVWSLAVAFTCAFPQAALSAPPSGGGSKVTVTAANPSEAAQGQELDVIVTGSGFDAGSSVSYLVTATTDASQVDVISVEYISSTQLKTRIRPKDAALVTAYDIQVTASTGRKGKGTTLFKVNLAETACTGNEPKEPEIAYLTGIDTSADLDTQDIYLSSASGCDLYVLVEDAALRVPDDGDPKNGFGEELVSVTDLRLDIEGNFGVVSWRDTAQEPSPQMGMTFSFNSSGTLVPEPGGPWTFYSSTVGADIKAADVRINALGEIELVLVERTADDSESLISLFNPDTNAYSVISAGVCHALDQLGNCFVQQLGRINWNEDGTEIFFEPANATGQAMGRLQKVGGVWQPAEILMTNPTGLQIVGVSPAGLVAYEYIAQVLGKRGKFTSSQWFTAVVDPELCEMSECVTADGLQLPVDTTKYPRGWTRAGGMLFIETGPGAQRNIREYSNPYTGEIGGLDIQDVDRFERDTTF
jgi:hypothetical protein